MTETLVRRGPDDEGTWSAPDGSVHLGFRRLSIVDLSPGGHQPIVSGDGRNVLVFNGEIYNYRQLRRELEASGVRFHTRSDTEVLLELLRRDGLAGLDRLNGMFGLAYVDLDAGTTLLARDHLGIKPLFYAVEPNGPGVAFASRYDALFHTDWVDVDDIDPSMLAMYLEFGHLHAPFALHRHCAQVEPGGWVLVDRDGVARVGTWWKAPHESDWDITSFDVAVEATRAAVDAAVGRQIQADVAVGGFLSGGVDSPTVAGMAAPRVGGDFAAYTVSCPEWRQDEGPDAAHLARALGVRHRVIEVDAARLDDAFDSIPDAMHEPLADVSFLPTMFASEQARSEMTVALSGDGGDELFFGYRRPLSVLRRARWWLAPLAVRRAYSGLRTAEGAPDWGGATQHPSPPSYYRAMLGHADLVPDHAGLQPPPREIDALFAFHGPQTAGPLARYARRLEVDFRLAPILKKVDAASMHHGLEVRVPLLDREVVDIAFRIAPSVHLEGWVTKAVLRRVLRDLAGGEPVSGAKRGFVVPLAGWLGGHFRERAEAALLDDWSLPVEASAVRTEWENFLRDPEPELAMVWTLLTLRWWRDRVARDVAAARGQRPAGTASGSST